MRNLISMKRNWCAGKNGEEEDELEKNKMKKIIKQQCSLMMPHENQSAAAASWSELDMDLLREINKKLCNYADHIRFRRVCKSWRTVGCDEKRAGDVLPWLMGFRIGIKTGLYKYWHEPPFKYDTGTVIYGMINGSKTVLSYRLQEPPLYDTDTVIYGMINVCDYFNDLSEDEEDDNSTIPSSIKYADGWLYISVYNSKSNSSNFLLFSLATKASFTLPQFNHCRRHPLYIAWSTTPDSPDCVFFAMCITDIDTRMIGIFRHGDTHWTTTQSVGGLAFAKLLIGDFVFIGGVFYFIITYRNRTKIEIPVGLGFYDLATGALNFELFSTNLKFDEVQNLFGLDGDLMLAYFEQETQKICIRKYDWSNKDWVPLQSLGGRSVYLSNHSVYVDHINYYSANKIYVYAGNGTSCVHEYTLEDDGHLSICTSTRLTSWFDPWPIWVPPPDVHLKK